MSTHNFKPGDRVRVDSGVHSEYEVLDGPFKAYVVKAAGDEAGIVRASALEPIPADPRVDVARDSLFAVVADQDKRDLYARTVLAALDAHSGKTCQHCGYSTERHDVCCPVEESQPRRVRDRDGDVWERMPNGTWESVSVYEPYTWNRLSDEFGPLEEI